MYKNQPILKIWNLTNFGVYSYTHETAATIQIAMVPVTTPPNVLESLIPLLSLHISLCFIEFYINGIA